MSKWLYYWINNGVRAVVTQEVLAKIKEWTETKKAADRDGWVFTDPYPTPIFTFSDALGLRGIVTGTIADMWELIDSFHTYPESIRVPFSNCGGSMALLFDKEAKDPGSSDLRFLTTLREVMDAFGLIMPEVPSPVLEAFDRPSAKRGFES